MPITEISCSKSIRPEYEPFRSLKNAELLGSSFKGITFNILFTADRYFPTFLDHVIFDLVAILNAESADHPW